MRRRELIAGAGATVVAASAGLPRVANAQDAAKFPEKPITVILPWPAGGSSDLVTRALAEIVGKKLGQAVIVDNRAGGSGTVGPATMAATAKPDGYTICHIPGSVYRFPSMQKMSYDPEKDFTYIIQLSFLQNCSGA